MKPGGPPRLPFARLPLPAKVKHFAIGCYFTDLAISYIGLRTNFPALSTVIP